jgi:hypothetical protein
VNPKDLFASDALVEPRRCCSALPAQLTCSLPDGGGDRKAAMNDACTLCFCFQYLQVGLQLLLEPQVAMLCHSFYPLCFPAQESLLRYMCRPLGS